MIRYINHMPSKEIERLTATQIFEPLEYKYKGKIMHRQNIWDEWAKQILEKLLPHHYISTEDFNELMKEMGILKFKNSEYYKLRLKKEFKYLIN